MARTVFVLFAIAFLCVMVYIYWKKRKEQEAQQSDVGEAGGEVTTAVDLEASNGYPGRSGNSGYPGSRSSPAADPVTLAEPMSSSSVAPGANKGRGRLAHIEARNSQAHVRRVDGDAPPASLASPPAYSEIVADDVSQKSAGPQPVDLSNLRPPPQITRTTTASDKGEDAGGMRGSLPPLKEVTYTGSEFTSNTDGPPTPAASAPVGMPGMSDPMSMSTEVTFSEEAMRAFGMTTAGSLSHEIDSAAAESAHSNPHPNYDQ